MDSRVFTKTKQAEIRPTVEVLDQLIEKEFRPSTQLARHTVTDAVRVLAEQVLKTDQVIDQDSVHTIQALIAELDRMLSDQLNEIIHQPAFQKLEGSWRGLHYLVNNTNTSQRLKIRVMNVGKTELASNLRKFKGSSWDQSPLFKRVYEDEFGQFGGEPFGCMIGDFEFDNSHKDVELMAAISRVAASAHCPFVAAANPQMMGMSNWTELSNPRDLSNIFNSQDYASWRSLRESSDSRYLALTLPRFASRTPYGQNGEPIHAFTFEESLRNGSEDVLWSNSAYAMGVNINRAFEKYGWCSNIRGIESGGAVQGLPTLRFVNDQNIDLYGSPTETTISDRREAELAKVGFMPLVYRKNSDLAAFIGARTIHQPIEYDDAESNENSELATRLPYVFAISRFAHSLKCIARDKVGSFKSRSDLQRWLNDWIMRYVDGDPTISSDEVKARRPLAAAEVQVNDIPGEPGYYNTTFYLRPHYQLEGLTVSLRLVGKIPSNSNSAG
jgi:type VI secretion system protein ImpC